MSSKPVDAADVHNLLGNQRRALVVGYLALFDQGESVAVRHVARVVRAVETGKAPSSVSTSDYESAYNGLIQSHLPRLAAGELIEYDENRKEITVTPQLHQHAFLLAVAQLVTTIG
ncbi:DUF7344 domain-containing protein [Halobacterium bonnevillei]|uniref:DUF7344 domain-containing protein n=1 Tax=Halobacterium bonnevillei TaxID=2692200 RepID=A0A6B0SJP8_9EURY|nr:hypothetical protein [Halobacterium bonnevillei]MXR21417.1 hypothetical protein [Halobacterium bonnevillei]